MRKNTNIRIIVIIAAILIMLPMQKAEAASFTVSNSSVTLDVEKTTIITINASTHTGRINITSSNTNVASVNTNSIWVENNSQSITITAKSEGNATITISGELYDSTIEGEQKYTQTINVTVNKVKVDPPVTPEPEPEQPTQKPTVDPEPEPEKPVVEEKPNFTDTNKTMYASKDINLRASWSTSSKATSIDKGAELQVTATSDNKVNGYVWYRVTYNGQTLYVASNLLTTAKPVEEKPIQDEPKEEPKDEEPEVTTDDPISNEASEGTKGLKKLEIEGLTLEPEFSANIHEYRVILKENLSELKINAEPVIENTTITIAGNQELQEGENLITIIVYNEKKEVEATYQIAVNKSTLDLSNADKMLRIGTKEATRNLIIFIAGLAIAIIVLIVILILKHRNNYEYYEEEEEESTNFEKNVENTPDNTLQSEQQETKREKRKGKHF